MTCSLGWEPVRKKSPKWLSDGLKFALRKRYGGHVDTILDGGDMSYLEGLRDAGVEDADTLIEAIKKYDSIHVREEC